MLQEASAPARCFPGSSGQHVQQMTHEIPNHFGCWWFFCRINWPDDGNAPLGHAVILQLHRDSHCVQRLPHVCLFIHHEGCHWYYHQFTCPWKLPSEKERIGFQPSFCLRLLLFNLKEWRKCRFFSAYWFSIVLMCSSLENALLVTAPENQHDHGKSTIFNREKDIDSNGSNIPASLVSELGGVSIFCSTFSWFYRG